VDTTTPSGEMMANVLAVCAQVERRLIGQRTREALAVKRSQGVRLGRPPTLSEATLRRITLTARAAERWSRSRRGSTETASRRPMAAAGGTYRRSCRRLNVRPALSACAQKGEEQRAWP